MSVFAVNKPVGPTSHDIVDQIRRLTGEKRVGHAGTLDPLASGVLVIAVGRDSTKQLSQIVQKDKEYLAQIKLGELSSTDDSEGIKTKIKITKSHVLDKLKTLTGKISQIPPQYSALKIKGQPAYKYARSGQTVNLKPRKVIIKNIKIINFIYPVLTLKITCGPGVYIRSLARDLSGHLISLTRTRVGQFTLKNSVKLNELKAGLPAEALAPAGVVQRQNVSFPN